MSFFKNLGFSSSSESIGKQIQKHQKQKQSANSGKDRQEYEKQVAAESETVAEFLKRYNFVHSGLLLEHRGTAGRTVVASQDIPAGTVLIENTPSAQFVGEPENSYEAILALGMQLLTVCSEEGRVPEALKETPELVSGRLHAVPAKHLYPTQAESSAMEDPFVKNSKASFSLPPTLPVASQQRMLSMMRATDAPALFRRTVLMAKANNVAVPSSQHYLLPGAECTTTSGRVVPCMEAVAPKLCVFPTMSMLNHTCAPNAAPTFFLVPHPDVYEALLAKLETVEDCSKASVRLAAAHAVSSVAVVRAVRDIKAGEEVSINYIALASMDGSSNLPWLVEFRQKHLRLNYGFQCECVRCKFALLSETRSAEFFDLLSKNPDAVREHLITRSLLNARTANMDGVEEFKLVIRDQMKLLVDNEFFKGLFVDGVVQPHHGSTAAVERETMALSDPLHSEQYRHLGTLTSINSVPAVIQCVRAFDKVLPQLLAMVEDDSGIEEAKLVVQNAEQPYGVSGTSVARSLQHVEPAKELAVALDAVKFASSGNIDDLHWCSLLLNVAQGTAYFHAGMHVLALLCRVKSLACIATMLRVDSVEECVPYVKEILAKIEPAFKRVNNGHPTINAAFDSVVESSQLALASVYAEIQQLDEPWIQDLAAKLQLILQYQNKYY